MPQLRSRVLQLKPDIVPNLKKKKKKNQPGALRKKKKTLVIAVMGSRTVGGRGKEDRTLQGGQSCVRLGRAWG